MGELRIHTKCLSENVKRGDVLGDVDIDFVDENELNFQKCFVMM
jgi:phosphotransferase system IIA component